MFTRHLFCTALIAATLAGSTVHAEEVKIPAQPLDAKLRAKLPAEILAAGEMTAANNGSFPPYTIVTGNQSMTGASADFIKALGEILGVKINLAPVNGLSGLLLGIKSGRYQFSMGPIGDFVDREARLWTSSILCRNTWSSPYPKEIPRVSTDWKTPAAAKWP